MSIICLLAPWPLGAPYAGVPVPMLTLHSSVPSSGVFRRPFQLLSAFPPVSDVLPFALGDFGKNLLRSVKCVAKN